MIKNKTLLADILILIVTLLAAGGWVFSKEALQGIAPLAFLGIRFTLAGLLLACFCMPSFTTMSKQNWKLALGMGALFSIALMIWVQGLFVSHHVGEGAFITSLGVVLVPVVAKVIFKNELPNSTWLALPIAIIGLALLSLNDGFQFENGQLLFAGAAVLFALHFNLNTIAVAQMPAFPLTSLQLICAGIGALTVSFFMETWPPVISQATWGWILASILLASAARFLIQTYAQSMASASHTAVILVLEPIWVCIITAFWFDETMTWLQLSGCALIFFALIINRWSAVRQLIKSLLYKR